MCNIIVVRSGGAADREADICRDAHGYSNNKTRTMLLCVCVCAVWEEDLDDIERERGMFQMYFVKIQAA